MRLQRPGRRAAQGTGYSAGSVAALAAVGYGLIRAEAKIARNTIGEPKELPPDPTGVYGRYLGPSLRLVMLGDSSATGLGCDSVAQTPGALLAGGIARDMQRRVRLDVHAVVGGRSADLDTQVAKALQQPVDVAVIMIGANDVTHTVWPGDASALLGRAVATLRAAGAIVVVGTCPDLGTVKPLLQPLKTVAAYWSRRMATAQAIAVAEQGGTAVSLGSLLAEEFQRHEGLWSADRFHPSADGYRRVADVLLPSVLEGLGVDHPVSVPVSDNVYDVSVAAGVAAREAGLVVETVEGEEGAAAVGPGRLVRLVRRLPLVGRGAPDERDDEAPDEEEAESG
ncbi:MAG: lipolytic enzyme family [Frankiales bacterium]|nr:lipolytic enzyme family [Frankiales bacterium]